MKLRKELENLLEQFLDKGETSTGTGDHSGNFVQLKCHWDTHSEDFHGYSERQSRM